MIYIGFRVYSFGAFLGLYGSGAYRAWGFRAFWVEFRVPEGFIEP